MSVRTKTFERGEADVHINMTVELTMSAINTMLSVSLSGKTTSFLTKPLFTAIMRLETSQAQRPMHTRPMQPQAEHIQKKHIHTKTALIRTG